MSHQSVVAMAGSQSLRARMVASAAAHNLEDPMMFVDRNMWQMVSGHDWAAAWDAATANASVNVNPDTGIRTDVITDEMIDASVTERISELSGPGNSDAGQSNGQDGRGNVPANR